MENEYQDVYTTCLAISNVTTILLKPQPTWLQISRQIGIATLKGSVCMIWHAFGRLRFSFSGGVFMTGYGAIRLAHLWRRYIALTTRFVVFIYFNPCLLTPIQWCIHAQHRNTRRDQSVNLCPYPRKETMGNEFIPCPNIWIDWKCWNRVRIVTYIPMGSYWRRILEKWMTICHCGWNRHTILTLYEFNSKRVLKRSKG